MLVRKFKFTDYDGNQREEEHCFYINKGELVKFLTVNGEYTLDKLLFRMRDEKKGKEIMKVFEEMIHLSYGRKSLDGRKFEKSEELWEDFYQTEAYSDLFTELVTDGQKAAEFINAIIPKELADEVIKEIKKNSNDLPAEVLDYVPKSVLTDAKANPLMEV